MNEDDPSSGSLPRSGLSGAGGTPRVGVVVACERWRAGPAAAPALCREAAAAALEAAGLAALGECLELDVRLTDDAELCRLNRRYRDRDAPTNVLSFPTADRVPGEAPAPPPAGAPLALGDVVLAYETVYGEAHAQGTPLADHLQHLVVHGVLHLAGYDHQDDTEAEVMERLETTILARLGVPDPYAPDAAPTRIPEPRSQPPEHP